MIPVPILPLVIGVVFLLVFLTLMGYRLILPNVIGAVSGFLVGCALGRCAKNPRPVIVAATVGGALGGILHWGLWAFWDSFFAAGPPGRGKFVSLIFTLVFWGSAILCGALSGALGTRLRRTVMNIKPSVYFVLGLVAFLGPGPLVYGAGRLAAPGGVFLIVAAAHCPLIADLCFLMAMRRWRWPLPLVLVVSAGVVGSLVSGFLAFVVGMTVQLQRGDAVAEAAFPVFAMFFAGGYGAAAAAYAAYFALVAGPGLAAVTIIGIVIWISHASSR